MPREFLHSLSLMSGQVIGGQFDPITSTDLPVSGVIPGEYALATLRVDEFGRVVSISGLSDTNLAYTDVANVFTAVPQQVAPGLVGVQWQFGLSTSERSERFVIDGDPNTYAELAANTSKAVQPFLTLRTVRSGITTAELILGNNVINAATGIFQGDGTNLTGVALLASANAFTAVQTITFGAGIGLSITPTAGGLYALKVFDSAAGLQFSVACDTGKIFTNDVIENPVGFRATAFGVYYGVLSGDRFEVRNGYIDTFITSATGFQVRQDDAATNTVSDTLVLRHNTSGTAAAGYGGALRFQLESSTTVDRNAALVSVEWATATDASRASKVTLQTYSVATAFTNLVATTTGTSVRGTTTNDDAAAGYDGEYATGTLASGSATGLTTATPKNVTSVSLTAGDWDVTGVIDYVLGAATCTHFKSGSSSTSATFGGQDSFADMPLITTLLSDTFGHVLPTQRFSLSATTTVYLVAQATFSAGTVDAYGTIRARRVR